MNIMSRFVTYKELREKYRLAEIFEFLKAGLKPLSDPSLFPIPGPEEHHECTNLPKIIEYLMTLKASDQSDAGNGCDNLIKKYKETIELAEADDPEHQSWNYFMPPVDESEKKN